MSDIYLVRHGITAANRENRFAGRSGEELLPEGMVQIQAVAERLRQKNITALFCGPAKRTVQSAEIVGSFLNLPVSLEPGLDEIYLPHWDGLTKEEIILKFGSQYPSWLAAPQSLLVTGCETLMQVQNRAVAAVEYQFSANRGRNLLLVSHLIVLRCLILYYRNLRLNEFRAIKIDNGSIIRISGIGTKRIAVEYSSLV